MIYIYRLLHLGSLVIPQTKSKSLPRNLPYCVCSPTCFILFRCGAPHRKTKIDPEPHWTFVTFFWHDTLRTFNMEHNYNDNDYEPKSNSQQIQVPRIWAASKPEVPAVRIFWWLVTQCVAIGGYYQQTPTNKTVFCPSSTCSIQPRI